MKNYPDELLELALRRYPNIEPLMALHCYHSDRREAGIGALKPTMLRELRPGQEIVRGKDLDPLRYRVVWTFAVRREARWKVQEEEPELLPWSESLATMTVTAVAMPAVNETLCLPMAVQDLQDQRGRDLAARLLWDTRRQLREMTR